MGLHTIRPAPSVALNQRGASFVVLLLALLIAAALYFGYFKMQNVSSARAPGIAAIDASRAVACRTNRQNIDRDIAFWSVNHPDQTSTLEDLARDGLRVPGCPEGGRYSIVGQHVVCSMHR